MLQQHITLKLCTFAFLLLLIASCADSSRDNALDPINAPVIDMREPVLDGGSVLIAWRYFADGDALTEFVVRKVAQQGDRFPELALGDVLPEGVSQVGRYAVNSGTSGWQTGSIRDPSVTAGVRVLYQVEAVSSDDNQLSSATKSFRLEGTRFELVESDPDDVAIRFRWLNEPTGTTGYDLQRTAPGDATEVIFSTDDPTVRSFADTVLTGNVVYDYKLVTRLGSGSDFSSDAIPAGLFVFDV